LTYLFPNLLNFSSCWFRLFPSNKVVDVSAGQIVSWYRVC